VEEVEDVERVSEESCDNIAARFDVMGTVRRSPLGLLIVIVL
jgi:hypothetical protein